jgi:hypothetical protein
MLPLFITLTYFYFSKIPKDWDNRTHRNHGVKSAWLNALAPSGRINTIYLKFSIFFQDHTLFPVMAIFQSEISNSDAANDEDAAFGCCAVK